MPDAVWASIGCTGRKIRTAKRARPTPFDEHGKRDGHQLAGHHGGPADGGRVTHWRARHGFEHGLAATLPELAKEQPDEEVLSSPVAPRQQLTKHPDAVGSNRRRCCGNPPEHFVYFDQLERGAGSAGGAVWLTSGRRARCRSSLPRLARQERDGDLDLLRGKTSKQGASSPILARRLLAFANRRTRHDEVMKGAP